MGGGLRGRGPGGAGRPEEDARPEARAEDQEAGRSRPEAPAGRARPATANGAAGARPCWARWPGLHLCRAGGRPPLFPRRRAGRAGLCAARGREARWEGRPGGPRGAFCVRKRPALTLGAPAVGQRGAAVAGPCLASQVETRLAGPADPPGAVAAPHGARSLARDAAPSLESAGRGEPDRGDPSAWRLPWF